MKSTLNSQPVLVADHHLSNLVVVLVSEGSGKDAPFPWLWAYSMFPVIYLYCIKNALCLASDITVVPDCFLQLIQAHDFPYAH